MAPYQHLPEPTPTTFSYNNSLSSSSSSSLSSSNATATGTTAPDVNSFVLNAVTNATGYRYPQYLNHHHYSQHHNQRNTPYAQYPGKSSSISSHIQIKLDIMKKMLLFVKRFWSEWFAKWHGQFTSCNATSLQGHNDFNTAELCRLRLVLIQDHRRAISKMVPYLGYTAKIGNTHHI